MRVALLGGRIVVRVEPLFWFTAAMIGFAFGGRADPRRAALWAVVAAVSILAHELGHAGACLAFGSPADVALHGFGGSTSPRDASVLKTWQRAVMTAAGCGAQLVLAALGWAGAGRFRGPAGDAAVALTAVNAWLCLVNLLPVSPLDGGHLVELVLQAFFGLNGRRAAHGFGLAVGAVCAAWSWASGGRYGALFFAALAAAEFRALRRALEMSPLDLDEGVRRELARARKLWTDGDKDGAVSAAAALRERTGRGLVHREATGVLARFLFELARYPESYALLKALPEAALSGYGRRMLQSLAYEVGDHEASLRHGRAAFYEEPRPETAINLAAAAAKLGDAAETVRWLRAAARLKAPPPDLADEDFDRVRGSAEFREYASERDADG